MPAIKVPAKNRNESRTRRRTTPTRIRQSLGRAFLETLQQDFWEHGPQLIVRIRNKQPARVFMGDVGSAFLGFTFAAVPFMARENAGSIAPLLPFAAILFVWFFLLDLN